MSASQFPVTNRTLTILKPDAVRKGYTGVIIDRILKSGFKIIAMKQIKLSKEMAAHFYRDHEGKSFFPSLIDFMRSGPIVAMILEKENAVKDYRDLIGLTDPKEAAPGTLRAMYGESVTINAVHAADSDENAAREGHYFFSAMERTFFE